MTILRRSHPALLILVVFSLALTLGCQTTTSFGDSENQNPVTSNGLTDADDFEQALIALTSGRPGPNAPTTVVSDDGEVLQVQIERFWRDHDEFCTESDGGPRKAAPGNIQLSSLNAKDTCLNSITLGEYLCSKNAVITVEFDNGIRVYDHLEHFALLTRGVNCAEAMQNPDSQCATNNAGEAYCTDPQEPPPSEGEIPSGAVASYGHDLDHARAYMVMAADPASGKAYGFGGSKQVFPASAQRTSDVVQIDMNQEPGKLAGVVDQMPEFQYGSGTYIVGNGIPVFYPPTNEILHFGGTNGARYRDKIGRLNLSTSQYSDSEFIPHGTNRFDIGAGAYDPISGNIYLVEWGLYEYNPNAQSGNRFDQLLDFSGNMIGAAAAIYYPPRQSIFILGGSEGGPLTGAIREFRPNLGDMIVWSETIPANAMMIASVQGDDIFLYSGSQHPRMAVRFNPQAAQGQRVQVYPDAIPAGATQMSGVQVDDNQVILVGGNADTSGLSSQVLVAQGPIVSRHLSYEVAIHNDTVVAHASSTEKVYSIGGSRDSDGEAVDTIRIYDAPNGQFREAASKLPTPRGWVGAAAYGNDLILAGGLVYLQSVYSDILRFDTETESLTAIGQLPEPSYDLCGFAKGNMVYFWQKSPPNKLYSVNPSNGASELIASNVGNMDRTSCGVDPVEQVLYAFGGYTGGSQINDEIVRIDPAASPMIQVVDHFDHDMAQAGVTYDPTRRGFWIYGHAFAGQPESGNLYFYELAAAAGERLHLVSQSPDEFRRRNANMMMFDDMLFAMGGTRVWNNITAHQNRFIRFTFE